MAPPTITLDSEYQITVAWNSPTDLGGLTVSYLLEVKTSSNTFEKDLDDCDAENDSAIIEARSCSFQVDQTLRENPFNLADLEPVIARVTAINDIGSSVVSDISDSGVNMPIADV